MCCDSGVSDRPEQLRAVAEQLAAEAAAFVRRRRAELFGGGAHPIPRGAVQAKTEDMGDHKSTDWAIHHLKTAPTDVDYRNKVGRVLTGPEYLSVLDGLTGQEIARVDWPARGLGTLTRGRCVCASGMHEKRLKIR